MRDALFVENKIKRQIKRNGKSFEVYRAGKDKYGQPIEPTKVLEFSGSYHEGDIFVQNTSGDSSTTQTEKAPRILCVLSDVSTLKVNDRITINGNLFTVSGITNVNELNKIADISLDEVN